MHILIDDEGNRYVHEKGDFHSKQGVIKEKDIQPGKIKTHTGKEFACFPATFADLLQKISRGPATMHAKDIGIIITKSGIGKTTKIVDAGTGSGVLAAYLANISNDVTTYESRKEHAAIAKKNFKLLNVNPALKEQDITNGIDERDVDVVTLDLLEPWKVVKHAKTALKPGGFLVAYCTNITQATELIGAAHKEDFLLDDVLETIQRSWKIEEKIVRPEHVGLLHTGFLVFLRKVQ